MNKKKYYANWESYYFLHSINSTFNNDRNWQPAQINESIVRYIGRSRFETISIGVLAQKRSKYATYRQIEKDCFRSNKLFVILRTAISIKYWLHGDKKSEEKEQNAMYTKVNK